MDDVEEAIRDARLVLGRAAGVLDSAGSRVMGDGLRAFSVALPSATRDDMLSDDWSMWLDLAAHRLLELGEHDLAHQVVWILVDAFVAARGAAERQQPGTSV